MILVLYPDLESDFQPLGDSGSELESRKKRNHNTSSARRPTRGREFPVWVKERQTPTKSGAMMSIGGQKSQIGQCLDYCTADL